jgi:hypothetical protein
LKAAYLGAQCEYKYTLEEHIYVYKYELMHIHVYKYTYIYIYIFIFIYKCIAELKAAYLRAQCEYKDTLEEHTSLLEYRELELELKNKDRNHGKGQEIVVMEDDNSFDYSMYKSEVKTTRNSRMIGFTNPLSLKISKVRVYAYILI